MTDNTDVLNNESPIPLYYQLKSFIENQIKAGIWKPGMKISSELELSQQFQISRTTVRQAIGDLVNEAKLERIQGRGTFVAEINPDKQIQRITGFSHEMKARGLVPSSEILKFKIINPPRHIARDLKIEESDHVIILQRLRKGSGKNIAIESAYFRYDRFHELLSIDLSNNSLYETMVREFNTIPKFSRQEIEAIHCPAEEAGLLGIETGAPVFLFHTIAFDQNDQPFERTEGYYRGDRYKIKMSVVNTQKTG